jgi:hypothetical protein
MSSRALRAILSKSLRPSLLCELCAEHDLVKTTKLHAFTQLAENIRDKDLAALSGSTLPTLILKLDRRKISPRSLAIE